MLKKSVEKFSVLYTNFIRVDVSILFNYKICLFYTRIRIMCMHIVLRRFSLIKCSISKYKTRSNIAFSH